MARAQQPTILVIGLRHGEARDSIAHSSAIHDLANPPAFAHLKEVLGSEGPFHIDPEQDRAIRRPFVIHASRIAKRYLDVTVAKSPSRATMETKVCIALIRPQRAPRISNQARP